VSGNSGQQCDRSDEEHQTIPFRSEAHRKNSNKNMSQLHFHLFLLCYLMVKCTYMKFAEEAFTEFISIYEAEFNED
jgi:hypothetical protein